MTAMVTEQGRALLWLNLDMLAQRVVAQALGHLDVGHPCLGSGWRVQAVRPKALQIMYN